MDKAIDHGTQACFHCAALRQTRNYVPSCLPAPEIECSQTQAQRIISLSYNRFKVFRYSFLGPYLTF